MKVYRLFVILAAAVASLAFCGCGDGNDAPTILHEVSRMNHFLRLDASNDLIAIANVSCEIEDIYGENVTYELYGSTTQLVDNTWKKDMGNAEPTHIRMTLKATPRGDSDVTISSYLLEAALQSEFTVYDQNNKVIGYNGFAKSMSKMVNAGTNIKSFLEANFPVTYSFVITKGDDGMYSVQIQ